MATQSVEKVETTRSEPERTRGGLTFAPHVDIREFDDRYMLQADVPGARAETIDINYERGVLTLHARVEQRQTTDATRWLLREYGVGDFHRTFQIGEGIDAAKIQAEVANGVLTLTLPKSDSAKVRKIGVKAG